MVVELEDQSMSWLAYRAASENPEQGEGGDPGLFQ